LVIFLIYITKVITVHIKIQYVGSKNTEKKVVISVIYKADFSKEYNFINNLISISHNAIFIKIAAIIGNGKNLKAQLKSKAEIINVKIAIKNQEVLLVAHEFIFKAVLIKTAVFGSHHNIHVQIFDNASQSTSLFLSNFTFVIFSAIFAEIIVSIIAIIETTKEITISHLEILKNSLKEEIEILKKGKSNKENFNSGYLSTNNNIFGKNQF
jgi:hypothetical protein